MARQNVTQTMVDQQMTRLVKLVCPDGQTPPPVLYQGNSSYRIPNRLLMPTTRGGVNVWPDGMAGFTKRDCYNALRLTIAGLCLPDTARGE